MDKKIWVEGEKALSGTVHINGAKNAVLPLLASLILPTGKSTLSHVPAIYDVGVMLEILRLCGLKADFDQTNHTVHVDATRCEYKGLDLVLMRSFRASILVAGALLSRVGKAHVYAPGGCPIGARPIDLHLEAFVALGAKIIPEGEGFLLEAPTEGLKGTRYVFDYPSVGATENALMAAVCARGETILINAAIEPEVIDLIEALNNMGARISFDKGTMIRIEGVAQTSLKGIDHRVISDRLEAATFLCACASAGGSITLKDAPCSSMDLFLHKLVKMGHRVVCLDDSTITIEATARPQGVSIRTMPYPGFPTDMQSLIFALLATAQGDSCVQETVFENRFLMATPLVAMGANINLDKSAAYICGVEKLNAAAVDGKDIRASAGLIIAALGARGLSVISGLHHVERGYENLIGRLADLGASIWIE